MCQDWKIMWFTEKYKLRILKYEEKIKEEDIDINIRIKKPHCRISMKHCIKKSTIKKYVKWCKKNSKYWLNINKEKYHERNIEKNHWENFLDHNSLVEFN